MQSYTNVVSRGRHIFNLRLVCLRGCLADVEGLSEL